MTGEVATPKVYAQRVWLVLGRVRENGSDADKIYLRLCSTNGGELAAYLNMLMIAHAEAVNRNERRVRTSEFLRPRVLGTMTNWKGLKACEFNWCPPFQVCHKA